MRRALLFVAPLLLVACSLQHGLGQGGGSGSLGTRAPALSGEAIDRQPLQVALTGNRTLVVFWASWCGPCRHEQPELNRLAADYAARGVRLAGVDMLDHDRAAAAAFVHEFGVPYPSVYDESGALTAAYQVDYPPSFVLVDSRGIVVARYPGEASAAQLRKLIEGTLLTSSASANG